MISNLYYNNTGLENKGGLCPLPRILFFGGRGAIAPPPPTPGSYTFVL
ncbi:MAG: hypothetical protein MJE68_05920 [Proteobacteria bacterium]|nr:hypothetical protein [Pseudomonadota bacterium]